MLSSLNKKGVEVFNLSDYDEVRALSYDMPIIGNKETSDFMVLTLKAMARKSRRATFFCSASTLVSSIRLLKNLMLTDVLYPNDNNEVGKRIRLKQEFLLASASIHDIIRHHLKYFPDLSEFGDKVRIQINDTHPALVIAELMRLTKEHDFGWGEAWEVVKPCCSYTNHTVLRESLEEWDEDGSTTSCRANIRSSKGSI